MPIHNFSVRPVRAVHRRMHDLHFDSCGDGLHILGFKKATMH